jgi:peptide/nickel transport system substrate-binding protein
MRPKTARITSAATLALALAAPALAEEPVRGGTLVYAVDAEPPNYDCQGTTTFAMMQTVGPHYSRLLRVDPDRFPNFAGDLAETWEASPDQLGFTFHLRDGVTFHDGTKLTAEDVKATFERIRKPPEGVVSVRKAAFEDIAAIETPDPRTVIFKLAQPNASMLVTLGSPWNCVVPAAKIKADPKWPERNILGSGPFRFKEHVAGSHWIGERFDGYFDKGKPYLDGFRAVFMKGSAMVNALQGGQIQAEFRGLAPADRDKVKAALGDKAVVEESPWLCKFDLFFNTKKKPYDDVRVRHALSQAIDRWKGAQNLSRIAFVRAVGGVLRPGDKLATPEAELEKLPGFARDGEAAKKAAKKLLKEAGAESLSFTLLTRNVPMPFSPVAVYLIDQWRQIGLKVEQNALDVSQEKAAFLAGNFDVGLDATCTDMDEPNAQLLVYLSSDKSPVSFSQFVDRELDALYDKQKRATSDADRGKLIREFETRLVEQSYTVPIVWWHRIVVHSRSLKGWKILPSHYLNQELANVWLDPKG